MRHSHNKLNAAAKQSYKEDRRCRMIELILDIFLFLLILAGLCYAGFVGGHRYPEQVASIAGETGNRR